MKSPNSNDKLARRQILLLFALCVLPAAMIVINGTGAVRSLFARGPRDTSAVDRADIDTTKRTDSYRAKPLKFGIYDPGSEFDKNDDFSIRHLYVSWSTFDADQLSAQLHSMTKSGFQPLLTIEPWPSYDDKVQLLLNVSGGKYDETIDRIAKTLAGIEGEVYISWGHEMDQDLTQRYPWSGRDPNEYIAAYRYVVDRLRRQTSTKLIWVWAGVLKNGSLRYWPGDQYVDYIGLPIYSYPDWDRHYHGYIRDFRTMFEEKRAIVQSLNKPLIITELGVGGSGDFSSFWLRQAFQDFGNYPELFAVVFFYAKDAEGAWGSNVSTPDWRVHPDLIRGMVAWNLRPN